MTELEEDNALSAAYNLLNVGGQIFIECRSVNDTLYRQGEVLSQFERLTDHYCRFTNIEILTDKLKMWGFTIDEAAESSGFAPFKEEDPVVIRIAASKLD